MGYKISRNLGLFVLLLASIPSLSSSAEVKDQNKYEELTSSKSTTGCSGNRFLIPKNTSTIDKKWSRKILDFIYGGPDWFQGKRNGIELGEKSPTPVGTKEMRRWINDNSLIRWMGPPLLLKVERYISIREEIESEKTLERFRSLDDVGKDPLAVSYENEQRTLTELIVSKVRLKMEDIGNDCD